MVVVVLDSAGRGRLGSRGCSVVKLHIHCLEMYADIISLVCVCRFADQCGVFDIGHRFTLEAMTSRQQVVPCWYGSTGEGWCFMGKAKTSREQALCKYKSVTMIFRFRGQATWKVPRRIELRPPMMVPSKLKSRHLASLGFRNNGSFVSTARRS